MHTDDNELAKQFQYTLVHDTSSQVRGKHELDLPTLTEFEQQQLAAWNATRQDYPQDACIPHLVTRQAIATPDAVAVVAGDQVLSYRGLNLRANRLARYLQMLGVKPNMLVGLCVERSLDMVVGLLGILKAGGAYVPLDPAYPSERLAFILEDAQAPVLVTQQRLARQLVVRGAQVVCLDSDEAVLEQQSEVEPTSAATINDLAYVIYTSGSTGHPKGVQITHKGLLNLLYWHQRTFALTPSDRATQLTSPAFDATGWELWPYLTCGASVYLPDEDTRISPLLLRDWLLSQKITITFLPTPLAESMIALEWPTMTSLRFLLTGADTLHHYPPATLPFAMVNNYGPTETTVVATFGPVPPTARAEMVPSIGRPIANMRIYILDEKRQQVPIGVSGELYIGGSGVARGYLHRPELTAEKFIPDPFSDEPDARLYKTGDLARFLPDGQIAFMGRTDHQVKIRGYRIELDEIAFVLNSHPAIQTSSIIAREDTPGDKRLVAYIMPTSLGHVTVSSLRETLMACLPDYMVPTTFVQLEVLPLTPNGKVDRAALPLPDETNTLRDKAAVTPGTATEKQVERIVASLLQVEDVGIEDNFFLLGGHSMLGAQLVVQVASTFGVDLSLRTLFEAPTVRQLSVEIERLILVTLEAMSDDEILHILRQE